MNQDTKALLREAILTGATLAFCAAMPFAGLDIIPGLMSTSGTALLPMVVWIKKRPLPSLLPSPPLAGELSLMCS